MNFFLSKIWGSHGSDREDYQLLGFKTVSSGWNTLTFRRNLFRNIPKTVYLIPWKWRHQNPHNKTDKCTTVKTTFLNTICHNSDMFRSILIIFREFMNINIACIKTGTDYLNTLKFVHKIFVNILKFFCSSAELVHKMRRLLFIGFYSASYQGGCQVYVLVANMASSSF